MFDDIVRGYNQFTYGCEKAFIQLGQDIEKTFNAASHAIDDAYNSVVSEYNKLGRKVEQLTNKHVDQPMRQILQEAYWSAPYVAALAPFAILGIGALAASVALLAVRIFDDVLDAETKQRMFQGIRNFCVAGAGLELARSVATLNPLFLLNIPFYMLLGFVAHENAKHAFARAV